MKAKMIIQLNYGINGDRYFWLQGENTRIGLMDTPRANLEFAAENELLCDVTYGEGYNWGYAVENVSANDVPALKGWKF